VPVAGVGGAGLLLAGGLLPGRPRAAAQAAFAPGQGRGYRRSRWNPFQRGMGVTEALMALNVGVYGLQQAYPGLVLKLARVRA
jgi:hypothetical protein